MIFRFSYFLCLNYIYFGKLYLVTLKIHIYLFCLLIFIRLHITIGLLVCLIFIGSDYKRHYFLLFTVRALLIPIRIINFCSWYFNYLKTIHFFQLQLSILCLNSFLFLAYIIFFLLKKICTITLLSPFCYRTNNWFLNVEIVWD